MDNLSIVSDNSIAEKNNEIIFSSSGKATAISALPIPYIDIPVVAYIQMDMIEKLAENYGIDTGSKTRIMLSVLFSTLSGSIATELALSIAKSTGLKTLFGNSMIKASINGFVTTLVGELYVSHFRRGGNIDDLELGNIMGYISNQFKDGKYSIQALGNEFVGATMEKVGIS